MPPALRPIELVVGSRRKGRAITFGYPDGGDYYTIPTYELTATGTDDSGRSVSRIFEVLRFGVQKKSSEPARVVGLADRQTHVIKAWLPTYSVHSARSVELGAWQVYGNFLIHDGPDNLATEVYASIGCIEICNGPFGFNVFNDFLISLAGSTAGSAAGKLAEIGRARNMSITYLSASRPPLEKYS